MLNMRTAHAFLAIVVGGGILTGCRDSSVLPTSTSRPLSASLSAQQTSHEHPGELLFEQISNEVPSFAGFFFEGGKLVTLVSDTSQTLAVEAVIRRVMADPVQTRAHPQLLKSVLLVRPATFSFRQLRQWRDQIEQVVPNLPDIASIGIDYAGNQVAIGLADGSGGAALENARTGLGVPPQGVRITTTGRDTPDQLLTDYVRLVKGGLLTEFTRNDTAYNCTLGFSATYNGTNVILTSSHCTLQMYQNDSIPMVFYQKQRGWPPDRIGAEWLDPPAIGTGCTIDGVYHQHCHRKSDAAMIKYDSGVAFDLGYIERTTSSGNGWGNPGSTTIDASNPPLRIVANMNWPWLGEVVQKVGWATGWTTGHVTANCVDTQPSDGWWRDCAYYADYYAGEGDSGSPVFAEYGVSATDVTLVGIHFGHGSNHADFSPFGGILQEFGAMFTLGGTVPLPINVSIHGPTWVPSAYEPVCYWTASVVPPDTGTAPIFFDWYVNDVWVTNGDQLDYGGPDRFALTLRARDSSVPPRTGEVTWYISAFGDQCGPSQ